jgi:uncharacterized membrane protein YhhN
VKSLLLAAYAVAAVGNVAGEAVHSRPVDWLTKPLLMPLLIAYAMSAARHRGVPVDRRLVRALALAWAGDVALEVPGGFIFGMLFFLGAYGTYAQMFLRDGHRPRPPVLGGYAVFAAAMLVWLWPGLAEHGLAVPMAVYAVGLTAMAVAATTRGPRIAAGGALLLVSDALIAMRIADVATVPGPPIWVMVTYTLGQALVVTGWVSAERPVAVAR